ncbi:T9SS type A sorting domain-containing protein [Chryseobacterium sp. RU33C]|uniref:T9SS type A sorting domain-containing protein n=1 Tax=Chryseobacterium sp. RU33C TaxID=1907398 RepID=UPI0009558AEB|nr:T9SS type A sorting domain-containing protein [Chryseobacterium sp. RU33C]SIR54123.1 Por secretion system C-terminal sorting domain-containing protein [Chryseobacterium sp. RU33C]
MYNPFYSKAFTIICLSYSLSVYSQLVGSDAQLWEKANPTLREVTKCKDENLLNFHCGIRDKLFKKYIKYSKNKSHTLTVVHRSKDDELIWENTEKKISLENNNFKTNGEKTVEIRKRPSIFSFTAAADPNREKSDSLKIKFEDQNLYEMIFFPKKVKSSDLGKIHSYLSIKYGISLEKGKYYSSDGEIIWDPEKHKEFKYKPTGLGRDNGNELYQKQSSNQADLFLTIGKNSIERTNIENQAIFDNNQFVIWSDDNKELALKNDGNFDVLQKNWEISFIGNKVSKTDYSIRILKEIMNPDSLPAVYWMFLKKPDGSIQKIQGSEDERYIIFNKVDFLNAFDSGDTAHFTFAVSPVKDSKKEGIGRNQHSDSELPMNSNESSLDLTKINLYPNPVKKGQTFTVTFPPMEGLGISIYDGAGRLVKLENIDRKSTHYTGQLDVQSAYIINLVQDKKIIKTFKLIVD